MIVELKKKVVSELTTKFREEIHTYTLCIAIYESNGNSSQPHEPTKRKKIGQLILA